MSSSAAPTCDTPPDVAAWMASLGSPLPDTRDGLVARLRDVESLLAWAGAHKHFVVRQLAAVSSVAEADVADACRIGMKAADRMIQRSRQLSSVSGVDAALADGSLTAAHGDALAESLRAQDPAVSRAMRARAPELIDAARTKTVDQFRRHLASVARAIRDELGIDRSAQHRHDTRCRTWYDKATGMWHLSGAFDPKLALEMTAKLDDALGQLYSSPVPANCPVDPMAKQDHLRALALFALTTGRAPNGDELTFPAGGVDISVVVDVTKESVDIDWGNGLEVPAEFLIELLSRPNAKIHGIAVRNGVVVFAPGRLDCGRDARLANRAQRRALRAMYATCFIAGCDVEFGHCPIHHIEPWEHGGRTDLRGIAPVCTRHHTKIHAEGWLVDLDPDRTLHVKLPDGTEMPRAGPNRHWG